MITLLIVVIKCISFIIGCVLLIVAYTGFKMKANGELDIIKNSDHPLRTAYYLMKPK